jgi:hypothetical protein
MEEKKLTREDRRIDAEQRNEYYMGSLAERNAAQATRDAIAADTILKNKRDTELIGENQYGIAPDTPMWKVKETKELQKQLNVPEKEIKPDAFTKWYEAKVKEKGNVTAKDLEEWHRKPGSEARGADGPGKSAAITHINREMVTQYLDRARASITAKGVPGSAETKAMLDALNSQDPLTGGPNESKTFEALDAETRKEYNFVKRRSQVLSNTMVPAEAVAQAQREYAAKNPPKAAAPMKPGQVRKQIKGKWYVQGADGKVYAE